MATSNNYDFLCKNGLVVAGNVIWASILTPGLVGIGTGSPSNTLTVNGTFMAAGNATLLGTLSTSANALFSSYLYVGTGASNVSINSSAISLAAGNILINTSTITIGAGATNNSINATNYSGIANNSTNFAGQPQAFYANVTSPIFSANITIGSPSINAILNSTSFGMGNATINTTSVSVGANMFMNTSIFAIGGVSAVNTVQNSSTTTVGQSVVNTTMISVGANVQINSTTLMIGNSLNNVVINSTTITGAAITGSITSALNSNDTVYFNHQLPSFYANVTSPNFSANITVGGGVTNVTVNATSFTGQANDTINFAGQPQAFYANVTSPMINVITIGNGASNALINSTSYAGTANNATWFAGQPQQIYANVTSPVFTSNITIGTGPANVVITPTTITGASILQANNATNFAGQPQAFYANVSNPVVANSLTVGNAQANAVLYPTNLIMGYFTVNVGSTQAQLSVGNAQVNTLINSTSMVLGTTLVNSTVVSTGLNTAMTVSGFAVGNSSINTTINSVSISVGNTTTNSFITTLNWYIGTTTVNTQINSTSIVVTSAFLTNTTYSQVLGGFRFGGTGASLSGLTSTQIGSTYNINVGAPSLFGYNWSGGLGELDLFVNRGAGSSGGVYVYDYLNNVATIMFSANMTTFGLGNVALSANGSNGSAGQVLTSNGTATYWVSAIINVAAQYTWTNTQTFSNAITFSNNILGNVINASSFTIGTSTVANSTGIYTGVVNGTSLTVGTSFTVNSTVINIGTLGAVANTAKGTAGQYLTSNSIGGTYWSTPAAVSVGGANTDVLVNDSTFINGTGGFTFNKATNAVFIANTLQVNASITSCNLVMSAKTSDYTLVNADSGTIILITNTTTSNVWISSTLTPGFRCMVTRYGTGTTTLGNNAGIDIFSRTSNFAITSQYGSASIFVVNSSACVIDGSI